MSFADKASWAALVPVEGVQGLQEYISGPTGKIPISQVINLQAELDSKVRSGSLARVATTGNYNDLNGLPALGSAAFMSASDFVLAPTAYNFQTAATPMVAGQQTYAVLFTVTMNAIPKVYTQPMLATSGELFFVTVDEDSITTAGFTFYLSGYPSLSTGKVRWKAGIEDQP